MPTTLATYRPRAYRAGASAAGMNAALKMAKKLMELKKEYNKKKRPAKKAAPKRKNLRGRRAGTTKNAYGVPARVSRSVYTKVERKHLKKYSQKLTQKFYVTSSASYQPLSITDGTITNPDMLYSPTSLTWENASIMMFNVHNTESYWTPVTALPVPGYRTGTQLVGNAGGSPGTLAAPNSAFIWESNATSTNLQSRLSPMLQTGLAENAVGANARYTIPSSLLTGISWSLKVCNPTIQAQMISVKLVRYNDGADGILVPGTLGDDATANAELINTMCNARSWTDNQTFSTIYSKTYRMPGIRPGTRLKMQNISHNCSMSYLRTQYRKQYNANNMATLGTQAKPSFVLAEDGKFYNACFLLVSSTCIDDQYIADVSVEKGTGVAGAEYFERLPQVTTYPPVAIPATVGNGKYKAVATGAQFGIAGTVTVHHRVQSIRRAIGSETAALLQDLQAQVDDLKLEKDKPPKPKKKLLVIEDGSDSDGA